MPLNFWLTRSMANEWVGCLLISYVIWIRRRAIPLREGLFWLAGPFLCGIAYCVMTLGQGWLLLPVSDDPTLLRDFLLPRYVDWVAIVPLSLLTFLIVAIPDGDERTVVAKRLLPAGAAMAVAALLYSAWSEVIVKTVLYLVFLGLSAVVFLMVRNVFATQSRLNTKHFLMLRRDVRFLAGLWAIYAIAILLGSDGIRFLLPSVTTATFENLDFALAVGFGFVTLTRRGRPRESEHAASREAARHQQRPTARPFSAPPGIPLESR